MDVVCLGKKMCKEMRGRKIMEIDGSSGGMCMRNIADIPKISKIRAAFGLSGEIAALNE